MTKYILIVAAERGLGLGLAKQFFDRGWSVVGTARQGTDIGDLQRIGESDPQRLATAFVDVTNADQIEPLLASLGDRKFDVIFSNAGIWGAPHQSVLEATDDELAKIMLTNAFGPIRLARHLLEKLVMPGGTLAFMSSHRGSTAMNVEGGLELYRASKVASNMLARGIYAEYKERGLTVLSIHPGWVNTTMGTLDGTVEAEIELEPSVQSVADVVVKHLGSGENLYLDYQDNRLEW
ncbi:SDR family NAD(P)-dependent oxidoreductase (plasmid) [Aliirhizobium terrae]|uniref:SDR family NAD(P)-dependent oxidoreductase n=1 Tax=Terrirhizobium terrae TaxID=2926709 RepID=UPI0025790A78|nr:SDR family NAD(P)-dependent oxidoreductase [Rhizobium sp. CC-CFT758]WJH37800.1 SDR family NAD(P)-dependent oxidoreductase [Rhizobium sp. CC-CFT758]